MENKTELNNEIKAKVFAGYLGQMVVTRTRGYIGEKRTSTFLQGTLKEVDLGMGSDCLGVHLENESDICNYINYEPGAECRLILKPLAAITTNHIFEVMRMYGSLWIDGATLTLHSPITKLKQAVPQIKHFPAHIHQYLQYEGYDLPHFLLENKTLQQADLAIYEEK